MAKAGASLVPIASPQVCVKCRLSNWNMLFLSTYFNKSNRNTFCGCCLNIFRNDRMASLWLMLVYRLSMSSVIRYALVGTLV